MNERLDFKPIEEIYRSPGLVYEPLRAPSPELVNECENLLLEFGNEPRSASELANYFNVSDRAVQNWFGLVAEAHCWLPESELKIGSGKNTRYTVLCVEKMQELKTARDSGLTAQEWIKNVQAENADRLQQPTAQAAINTKVVEEPTAATLVRIQKDRYMVPNFGSDRLAKAQERSNNQRSSLTNTQERVRQALLGLATQTAEDTVAGSLDKQSEREAIYEEAYADGLEELQIRHAAKRDAAADWESFKAQAMGKQPGNAPAAVS